MKYTSDLFTIFDFSKDDFRDSVMLLWDDTGRSILCGLRMIQIHLSVSGGITIKRVHIIAQTITAHITSK